MEFWASGFWATGFWATGFWAGAIPVTVIANTSSARVPAPTGASWAW